MNSCSELYHCHRWDCKTCSAKKLFWLREQALCFASGLVRQETYFTTLKGTTAIENALDTLRSYTPRKKANKARYNAKKEYFFVISQHGRSEWHIHIISNYQLGLPSAHEEKVRSRRATCLYMVENLSWSRGANYGGIRRYGGSSLLYKQSAKKWLKIRIRLFKAITRYIIVSIIVNAIIKAYQVSRRCCNQRRVTIKVYASGNIKCQGVNRTRPPPFGISG